jgi:hypothetical protein
LRIFNDGLQIGISERSTSERSGNQYQHQPMPTQPQIEAQVNKLIANAKDILTNNVGISLGVRKMNKILAATDSSVVNNIDLSVFREFEKKIDGCPVGSERLLWEREALKKKDIVVDKVIRIYRDKIIDKCYELISLPRK